MYEIAENGKGTRTYLGEYVNDNKYNKFLLFGPGRNSEPFLYEIVDSATNKVVKKLNAECCKYTLTLTEHPFYHTTLISEFGSRSNGNIIVNIAEGSVHPYTQWSIPVHEHVFKKEDDFVGSYYDNPLSCIVVRDYSFDADYNVRKYLNKVKPNCGVKYHMFKDLEGNEGVYWNTKVGAFNEPELIKYRNRDLDSFYVEKAVYREGSKTWGLVLKAELWDLCNHIDYRVNRLSCEGVTLFTMHRIPRDEGINIFKGVALFENSQCDPCKLNESIVIDQVRTYNESGVVKNYPNKIILTPAQIKKLFNCRATPTGDDNKGL